MPGTAHGNAQDLTQFTDAAAAVAKATEIYDRSTKCIRDAFADFSSGQHTAGLVEAHYPYLGIELTAADLHIDSRPAYGTAPAPGQKP